MTCSRTITALALAGGMLLGADLDGILARWRSVRMPFNTAGLTARERQTVEKLVEASRLLDRIFWEQSDPAAFRLYQTATDRKLRRLLWINGSRFDLLDENRPFTGGRPMPPGRGFYPPGITREQIEQYVARHPVERAAVYNPYTVVRGTPDKLEAVPYRVAYREWLEPAARALRQAAALSDDAAFARFLRLRADALLSDDYYPSDLAWLELQDPKIDIIFAPYETYLDELLGVKGSYGAAVLIRNEAESRQLAAFQKYVADIQDALPLPAADRPSKRGHRSPMQVMDAPYRSGDLNHGYQAVADNLPNDPRIHQEKGSKKIFFKNFMDARVEYIILPVAKRLMQPAQAAKVTGEGYLIGTLTHEIAHGLGPTFTRSKAVIREAIGPAHAALEEAKADVVGMFGVKWLVDHGALPKERLEEYYASYLAGIFRTLRFGAGEAHGRAEMTEFNYLLENRAISYGDGVYNVDYARMPPILEKLAKQLLEIEATGDRARAENWFARYGKAPVDLEKALARTKDIPVDIDPVFSFADDVGPDGIRRGGW